MGFFDLPEHQPDDEVLEPDEDDFFDGLRPAAWVAGIVPVELLVARSDQAAVVVNRIAAYQDGFELTVNSYLHRSVRPRRRHRWARPLMSRHDHDPGEPVPDEFLRFGLAWPDGGRATNLDGWGQQWPDATEPSHGLDEQGGGGSDREYSQQYWAWPVPTSGELLMVVEWPAFGIPETAAGLDAAVLVEAAGRSHPVWDEDATRPSHMSRGTVMRAVQYRAPGSREPAPDGLDFDL
jgi:hypothetical protein